MFRNTLFSRRKLAGLITMLAFAGAPMADAQAETIIYKLDQSNVESAFPDGIDYLRVAITSNTAGTASFSVTPVFPFPTGSNYGLQSFAFNYSGSASSLSISGLANGWTVDAPPPTALDGFGKFDYIIEGTGSNRQASLNFTVSGLGGSTTGQTLSYFAKQSSGNNAGQGFQFFAAHLAGFQGTVTSADFAGSTVVAVPEPESYAMLLAGLGFVAALARRRRAN